MDIFRATSHKRILIIGNDPRQRALRRTQLAMSGVIHIQEAATGDEGIECIRTFHPDAILCDLVMQPYDGIALTLNVRRAENSPHPYVPIILIMQTKDRDRLIAARDAGVNAVLLCPVSTRNLQVHLMEILENPRPFVRAGNYFGPDRRMRPRAVASAVMPH